MELSFYGKLSGGKRMTPIQLERREPAGNRMRFYAITVTRTLFDGWALVRKWGRIGRPGRGQGGRRQPHRHRVPPGVLSRQ